MRAAGLPALAHALLAPGVAALALRVPQTARSLKHGEGRASRVARCPWRAPSADILVDLDQPSVVEIGLAFLRGGSDRQRQILNLRRLEIKGWLVTTSGVPRSGGVGC